jgi:hypothetical protein
MTNYNNLNESHACADRYPYTVIIAFQNFETENKIVTEIQKIATVVPPSQ